MGRGASSPAFPASVWGVRDKRDFAGGRRGVRPGSKRELAAELVELSGHGGCDIEAKVEGSAVERQCHCVPHSERLTVDAFPAREPQTRNESARAT